MVTDLVESFHERGRVVKFVPTEILLGNICVYDTEFDVPKKGKSRQYDGILRLKTHWKNGVMHVFLVERCIARVKPLRNTWVICVLFRSLRM
jgi:hypothetical protein